MTYADPRRCPGCRRPLPPLDRTAAEPVCPACDLPLSHPLTGELRRTLARADRLVVELHQVRDARLHAARRRVDVPLEVPVREPVPAGAPAPGPASSPAPVFEAFWADIERPQPVGLRGSSVPAVLLGLGGLCLGVAAIIFLAVAWTWLGVGGRTAVLVTLTAAAAAGGVTLARRGLRAGAEALTSLSAVLLTLDLVGARHAGWLGEVPDAQFALVLGLALAAGAMVLTLLAPRLVAPQVAAGLGVLGAAQAVFVLDGAAAVPTLLTVVVLVGLLAAARTVGRPVLAVLLAVAAGVAWLELVGTAVAGLVGSQPVTVRAFWGHAPGWTLLAAALLLASPAVVARGLAVAATALAASGVTLVLVTPVLDNGPAELVTTAVVLAAAWALLGLLLLSDGTGLARVTGRAWVALTPALLTAAPVALADLVLVARAAGSALAPVTGDAARLGSLSGSLPAWLVVPSALAVLLVGFVFAEALPPVAAAPATPGRRRRTAAVLAGAVVVLGALSTLALLPVAPGWLVLGCALVGTAAVAAAVTVPARLAPLARLQLALAGLTLAVVALVVATVSPVQVTLVTGLLLAGAVALLATDRSPGARELGGLLLPLTTAGLLVTAAQLLHLDTSSVGVPVLVLTGLTALVLPRIEVEAATAVAWVVVGGAAVAAADHPPASLALHLTIAGALVVVASLLRESRRPLAPVGGLLLVLASWVRLADLGVGTPEAYTLPSAVVLLGLGVWHLRRVGSAHTSRALGAGLSLATVPSLLWVLAGALDGSGTGALSLRALLLGLTCLVLVLAGARLRWAAPLVVGASVGAVLAVAELAPYAPVVPQWLLLGGAGLLLVVVGVTWEARLQQVRHAAAYVGRLR